jgi:hypothetical protein
MNLLDRIHRSLNKELVVTYQEASEYFPASGLDPLTFGVGPDTTAIKLWCETNGMSASIEPSKSTLPSYKIKIKDEL